jgi:hypothetical protein
MTHKRWLEYGEMVKRKLSTFTDFYALEPWMVNSFSKISQKFPRKDLSETIG